MNSKTTSKNSVKNHSLLKKRMNFLINLENEDKM